MNVFSMFLGHECEMKVSLTLMQNEALFDLIVK